MSFSPAVGQQLGKSDSNDIHLNVDDSTVHVLYEHVSSSESGPTLSDDVDCRMYFTFLGLAFIYCNYSLDDMSDNKEIGTWTDTPRQSCVTSRRLAAIFGLSAG